MFGLRKTLSPIILIVVFFALASLASYFYSSDQAKQAEINNSPWLQKGKAVLNIVLNTSSSVADSNVERNIGFGDKLVNDGKNFILSTDWRGIMSETKTTKEFTPDKIIDYSTIDGLMTNNPIDNVENITIEITNSAVPVFNLNNETSGFFSKLINNLKEEFQKMQDDVNYSNPKVETIFNVKNGERDKTSAIIQSPKE